MVTNDASRKKLDRQLKIWLKVTPPQQRGHFVTQLVSLVLESLPPQHRSRLYVKSDEIALENAVKNKTKTNFYQTLGVNKNASPAAIQKAYQKKKEELAQAKVPQKREKLRQLETAYQTLIHPKIRQNYQKEQIASTVTARQLSPRVLHLRISRFSPTTLADLQQVLAPFNHGSNLDTLILDLRDNVGGAIDGLPYFLGPFIGKDRYAYEIFQQGQKQALKTKTGWLPALVRYKRVVVLVNKNTQSSAEVFAAVLKKYNVGVLVGETTRGWGTIERVFPIRHQISKHNHYSIFLVHHLTLRDDGQPIQGHGVDPVINIHAANWKQEFAHYFSDPAFAEMVEKVWREE